MKCSTAKIAVLFVFLIWGKIPFCQNTKSSQSNTATSIVERESQDTTGKDGKKTDPLLDDIFDNDTIILFSQKVLEFEKVIPFDDTLISQANVQYDLSRANHYLPSLLLGNVGSPSKKITFHEENVDFVNTKQSAFQLYRFDFKNFKFNYSDHPFTQVQYFTSTGTKDDNIFRGEMSRRFAKNLDVIVQYCRINQTGELKYDHSRNTNLSIGFYQNRLISKWRTSLLYVFNQFLREENGGLINEVNLSSSIGNTQNPLNLPVYRSQALSKTGDWGVKMLNSFPILHLENKQDTTLRINKNGFEFLGNIDLSFEKDKRLFYDKDTSLSLSFYKRYFNDIRGIQNLINHQKWQIDGSVLLNLKNNLDTAKNYFRGGISLQSHRIQYDPIDSNFLQLVLFGKINVQIGNKISLNGGIDYLLNTLNPNYKFYGDLRTELSDFIGLSLHLVSSRRMPNFLYQKLNLNQKSVISNKLNLEQNNQLGGKVLFPKYGFEIGIDQFLLSNFTYFDQNYAVHQVDKNISIQTIYGTFEYKISVVGTTNQVIAQKISNKLVNQPELYSKNSLFFEGKLFKKHMLLRTGFEMIYLPTFNRLGYSPLLGDFINSNDSISKEHLNLDFFLSFKVRLFRFTLRVDNIQSYWGANTWFPFVGYPQDLSKIRFGINWIFNN